MSELRVVRLKSIRPSLNARGKVGDVDELALSLKVLGLQKPLIVIPAADDGYDILDGHRRYAAAVKAGLQEVEVIVRAELGEAGRIQAQLAMETHAKQFDPMSEARALHTLMFKHNLSREQISRAVGRPPAWVRDRIALTHLTPQEQDSVQSGGLSIVEAKFRLGARRAERDGSASPKPAAAAPVRSERPSYSAPHFNHGHPLKAAAKARCDQAAGHGLRSTVNGIACGECWEAVIREDALTVARPS